MPTNSLIVAQLLLNPTQENEAAIKGLDYIANLIIAYRWQEKSYQQVSDFAGSVVHLYTAILEYDATLLVHTRRNPPKRWLKNVTGEFA